MSPLDFLVRFRVADNDLTAHALCLDHFRLLALFEIGVLFLADHDNFFNPGFNVPCAESFLVNDDSFRGFEILANNAVSVAIDGVARGVQSFKQDGTRGPSDRRCGGNIVKAYGRTWPFP